MRSVKRLQDTTISLNQTELVFESRILWRNLANWIREYLVSVYAGYGIQAEAEKKINAVFLENSNIIRLVFGEQNSERYNILTSDFVSILKSLVAAQINGDVNAVNEYTKQLYENADQRAAFAEQINPFWLESEWKSLLYQFIQMTIEESTTLLKKQYTKNIVIYDSILKLTSKMGDYYSKGMLDYLTYNNQL
ncbi:hypothetical protein [Aminipila sp.]|uniref:hypothetical protein n=1 Tax=Aminipila sp. TaxID=2060095 RepID=UPI0028986A65|nr:hypothetical protein [Aminipila sp.]